MWDLRIVSAQMDGDNWVWDESFHQKYIYVQSREDPAEIFKQECKYFYPKDFLDRCEIVDDGDVIELRLNYFYEEGKPVFAMVKEKEYV